jgi:hypothetical protein
MAIAGNCLKRLGRTCLVAAADCTIYRTILGIKKTKDAAQLFCTTKMSTTKKTGGCLVRLFIAGEVNRESPMRRMD